MTTNVSEINQDQASSNTMVRKSRWMGALILVAIFGPMLAAYVIYHSGFGIPLGTINKGDLLPEAKSIADISVSNLNGNEISLIEGKQKWRLLIPSTESCGTSCQKNLYTTRQVHVRLGEKARRVERVLLMPKADIVQKTSLAKDHPKLAYAVVNPIELESLLKSELSAGRNIYEHYYLMDQEGFIMMSYGTEHTGNELLTDVKRMLKYSYQEQ